MVINPAVVGEGIIISLVDEKVKKGWLIVKVWNSVFVAVDSLNSSRVLVIVLITVGRGGQ